MTRLLQSLVAGLGQGSIYALLALGYVIIYKSTRVISFAQPGLMAFGSWWVIYFSTVADMDFYLALAVAVLMTAAMAALIERIAIRPMIGEPVFAIAILTIGVDIVLRILVNDLLGSDIRSIPDPWGLKTWSLGGIIVQQRYVAMIVAATSIVAMLFAFFKYTRTGLAMRATAFDQEVALAQGISVGGVFSLSWVIAGALAAIAGMFVGSGSGIDQQTAFVALRALPAMILGGLDSVEGAVIGALAIGIVESL
ncbi:MAG TPA: branched-chain amino acid ABC transporter permease, partial [Actinomycetota bacterium]|nr:branched-chain amino acid ABC transporter permease [Actinomycetota bacterium]